MEPSTISQSSHQNILAASRVRIYVNMKTVADVRSGILKHAGHDGTASYAEVHAPSLIKSTLDESKHLGKLDTSTVTEEWSKYPLTSKSKTSENYEKPDLSTLINTYDFEEVASHTLTTKTWAFYSSAATDLHTKRRNNSTYSKIGLRPRILTNVKNTSTSTTMLGQKMAVPIYGCPTALMKLVDPDGEKTMGRGLKRAGCPQTVSTQASFPIDEIFEGVRSGPYVGNSGDPERTTDEEFPIFFQLYVDKDRSKSEALLKKVEAIGVKAIFVTVDAPIPGKREADERVKSDESIVTPMSGVQAKNDKKGGALGRIMGSFVDSSLCWKDLAWLRRCTSLPLVLKGVQTSMDAKMAMEHGIDGIVLSNHGGRSLDTSPASIMVLLELQKNCPEVFDKMEVFVDGGIMRGTDIFKALCLGAKAVGIGRGLLYALNYGEEGVEKYIESKYCCAVVDDMLTV